MDLHVRAASPHDAAAVDELLVECALAYLDQARGGGEAAERIGRPGSDPARDSAVVLADGRIIGFGHVWMAGEEVRCFARVRPADTGFGAGAALLDRLESRAGELANAAGGVDLLTATAWARDQAAPALLRTRGYQPRRYFLRMVADLDTDQPPGPLPPEVTVDTFDPRRDTSNVFAAWSDTFADHFGQSGVEAGDWWRERRDDATVQYDPTLWLVARAGRDIVGLCLGREVDESGRSIGFVGDIGVRAAWRGTGIGYALLTRMLAAFRSRGLPAAALTVDAENLTGALRLYHKAGMRDQPAFTIWGRQLRPTS
jgi:mycothiol synthase